MTMLSHPAKQRYLYRAGYYKKDYTGKLDDYTRECILAMKKDYMPERVWNKTYTKAFDRLLVSYDRVRRNTKNFQLKEFVCGCGGKYCSGAPAKINEQLLENLQTVRDKYGPVTITSGMRCEKYNSSLAGSSSSSKHMSGKACDIYIAGQTDTKAGREEVIKFWYTLPGASYAYSDTPNMGNAVHVDVK